MTDEPRVIVCLLNASASPVLESAALGFTPALDWERDDNAEWGHLVKVALAKHGASCTLNGPRS